MSKTYEKEDSGSFGDIIIYERSPNYEKLAYGKFMDVA
jgi:hypothetical protein